MQERGTGVDTGKGFWDSSPKDLPGTEDGLLCELVWPSIPHFRVGLVCIKGCLCAKLGRQCHFGNHLQCILL